MSIKFVDELVTEVDKTVGAGAVTPAMVTMVMVDDADRRRTRILNIAGGGLHRLKWRSKPSKETAVAFDPPTIAQAIEVVVRHQPNLSEREIAQAIFGAAGYQQRVNPDLRWLTNIGYVRRDDSSGVARYTAARPGP